MGDKSNNDTFYEDGYMDEQRGGYEQGAGHYLDSFGVGEQNEDDDYDSNEYYDEERGSDEDHSR